MIHESPEMNLWKICGKLVAIGVENLLSFTIIHYIPLSIGRGAIFSRPLSKTTHYGMLHLYWLSYRIDCSHQNPCALVGLDPLYHQRSGVAIGWNPNWRWWRWKWQQDIRRANAGVAMIIGSWLNLVHDAEGRWLVTMAASDLWPIEVELKGLPFIQRKAFKLTIPVKTVMVMVNSHSRSRVKKHAVCGLFTFQISLNLPEWGGRR